MWSAILLSIPMLASAMVWTTSSEKWTLGGATGPYTGGPGRITFAVDVVPNADWYSISVANVAWCEVNNEEGFNGTSAIVYVQPTSLSCQTTGTTVGLPKIVPGMGPLIVPILPIEISLNPGIFPGFLIGFATLFGVVITLVQRTAHFSPR